MTTGRALRPALVVNHLKGGGKEQVVVNLANTLAAFGHTPLVICLERGGALARRLNRGVVDLVELNKPKGNSVRAVWDLTQAIRAGNVDLVHSHNWGTLVESLLAARLAGGLPVVHTQHGLDFERSAERSGSRVRLLVKRLAAGRLDRLVTVSEEVRSMVVQEWGAGFDRVDVITNGVVVPPRTVLSPTERALRRVAVGLPPDAFVVGSVGYLRPVKDYPALVHAFAQLLTHRIDARLVLVGSGPSKADIERTVCDLGVEGSVHLLGARSDIADLLPLFDVFALSSLSEGISLAILEAMSHGLPVVATRVGGNPQIVEDGRSGRLVAPQHPQALADALTALSDAPETAAALGHQARARVTEHFSVERMGREYAGVYESVCR